MELHDYQKYAVQFIEEHPIAALFLDMGLGKTITTLTAIHNLMFDLFAVTFVKRSAGSVGFQPFNPSGR